MHCMPWVLKVAVLKQHTAQNPCRGCPLSQQRARDRSAQYTASHPKIKKPARLILCQRAAFLLVFVCRLCRRPLTPHPKAKVMTVMRQHERHRNPAYTQTGNLSIRFLPVMTSSSEGISPPCDRGGLSPPIFTGAQRAPLPPRCPPCRRAGACRSLSVTWRTRPPQGAALHKAQTFLEKTTNYGIALYAVEWKLP
jgi:hypothetical protein